MKCKGNGSMSLYRGVNKDEMKSWGSRQRGHSERPNDVLVDK